KRYVNRFGQRHHLLRGYDLLEHLYRPCSARDPAISDKGYRLVVPFLIHKIQGVFQGGRITEIVFASDDDIGVRAVDDAAPALGMFVLVMLQTGVLRFIQEGKVYFL